jgi:hypothetical protein
VQCVGIIERFKNSERFLVGIPRCLWISRLASGYGQSHEDTGVLDRLSVFWLKRLMTCNASCFTSSGIAVSFILPSLILDQDNGACQSDTMK